LSNTIDGYIKEVIKLSDDMREKTAKENKLINDGVYALAADPNENYIIPSPKAEVPYLNFAPILNAFEELNKQSILYNQSSNKSIGLYPTNELNQLLKDIERSMTRDQGLPRRPWYQHHIYAPGFYTGYGVKTLPGVREAIEQRDFVEAQEQITILSEVLLTVSEKIKEINTILMKD
jgi:N-acetylated-alpha-linked acidic dipeptidase